MWPLLATLGSSIFGSILSSHAQSSAASSASDAQILAAQQARDAYNKMAQPYLHAGQLGVNGQLNLAGLNGNGAQQNAIDRIRNSAGFQAQVNSGENAILANAAATGGLRGGNVQAALGQFRPALLGQAIDAQYARLGGLSNMGQNAAAGAGANASNMYQNQGDAAAGNALAQGQAQASMWGGLSSAISGFAGRGGFGAVPQQQPGIQPPGGIF